MKTGLFCPVSSLFTFFQGFILRFPFKDTRKLAEATFGANESANAVAAAEQETLLPPAAVPLITLAKN